MNIIEAKGIYKNFGEFVALRNIDLTIRRGEFFGCFGPNGAGKTTLLKTLSGQTTPTKGIAKVFDINVRTSPIEVKRLIGIVPEVESPPSYLTGREYLYFVGKMRNVVDLEEKIEHWLDFFELKGQERTICKDLSKGMRQKLMLASAFIHEPKLLFLDEPFINLDPLYQRKVRNYLLKNIENSGTIFMCTHILEIAEKICTRIAIIDKGSVLAQGTIEEMKEDDEDLERTFMRLVSQ